MPVSDNAFLLSGEVNTKALINSPSGDRSVSFYYLEQEKVTSRIREATFSVNI